MKHYLLATLIFLCGLGAHGQRVENDLENAPTNAEGQVLISPSLTRPVYFFNDPKQCDCRDFTVDGLDFRQMRHNDKVITISRTFWQGYVVFFLSIRNLSDTHEFTFDPAQSVMDYSKKTNAIPNFKLFKTQYAVHPDVIAQKIESRAAWSNALFALGASMQIVTETSQTTGNANIYGRNGTSTSGTYSSTTTTTRPDYEARKQSSQRNAENMKQARETGDVVSQVAFRKNTIFPGTSITGAIFFKDVSLKQAVVAFPIDGYQYVMFFVNGK